MFRRVAIAGMGLIGGSLGLALRGRRLAGEVVGIVRRPATAVEAVSAGAADDAGLDPALVSGADLLVLAAPILACETLLADLAPHLSPGCLVTDVGSTKERLMRTLPPLLPPGCDFVGGHPMAGSEKGGVAAARADLFEGAVWVLTRGPQTPDEAVARLAQLTRALGATPVEMEPHLHDDAVARISHLPHIVAAALAEAAGDGSVPADVLRLLVAGGFRTTTRIAASSPEMWRDICLTNRDAALAALSDCESALARFRSALEAADSDGLLAAFQRGKAVRDSLLPPE
jgi:prephenate dehydrogenase